jgi:hypothetical protein
LNNAAVVDTGSSTDDAPDKGYRGIGLEALFSRYIEAEGYINIYDRLMVDRVDTPIIYEQFDPENLFYSFKARGGYINVPSGSSMDLPYEYIEVFGATDNDFDSATILPEPVSRSGDETARTDLSADDINDHLFEIFKFIFLEAEDVTFEDGIESSFSRKVQTIVRIYGNDAVSAIDSLIRLGRANAEIAEELMRQVGLIEDPPTLNARLKLLLGHLESPDPRIIDAASLGIAHLDDPRAIEGLGAAMQRERSPLLKRNLNLVLEQLQATESGELSTNG